MKFYLDFEATNYTEKIISIGCTSETGSLFTCYVKPYRTSKPNEVQKIDHFITELTGITNETLEKFGLHPDVAFNRLFDFILEEASNSIPEYYCYGYTDAHFIANTLKIMHDPRAITFATALQHSLINFAESVKSYLGIKNEISLRKAFILCTKEDTAQSHDALKDALMLQHIATHLDSIDLADVEKIIPMTNNKPFPPKAKAPEIFITWENSLTDRWKANTLADETNWLIKCVDDNKTKYFDSAETAALWCIKYFLKGYSPKKEKDVNTIKNRITNAIKNNKHYMGFEWIERKEEN